MSRVGLKFGDLTVLAEQGKALRCRCKCSRVGWYPAAISKPTYKGRRQCEVCAGRPCEVCGAWINAQPGQQSPTCSEACRKVRAARRERERYQRVKDTPAWRTTRATYLQLLKDRASGEPEFARVYWAFKRAAQLAWLTRANADPAKREALLQAKREQAAAWRADLRTNPAAYLAHLQAARDWYASLSAAERDRIYNQPRREARDAMSTPLIPAPDAVRAARDAAGHSQSQAAKAVHLGDVARWSEYERGVRTIDAARWELYLLLTGQHPTLRVVPRDTPGNG